MPMPKTDDRTEVMVDGEPRKIAPDEKQPGWQARSQAGMIAFRTVGSVYAAAREIRERDAKIRERDAKRTE